MLKGEIKADEKKIIMIEGEYGIKLPITITGAKIAADETIKFYIIDSSGIGVVVKDYTNIENNTFDLSFTRLESRRLKANYYIYKIDWYKEDVFLGTIIEDGIFEVRANRCKEVLDQGLNLQTKIVIPSKDLQKVTYDDGFDALGEVIVNGDENLVSENIKEGVSVFGIAGSYIPELEDLTVIPNSEEQTFKSSKYGYNNVTVESIPNEYIKPEGTLEITENGEYDVIEKEKVNVNVGNFEINDASYLFYKGARLNILDELLSLCKNVTKAEKMFGNFPSSGSYYIDLSKLDTSNIEDMSYMLEDINYYSEINMSNFVVTNKTTNLEGLFHTNKAKGIDVSRFDTSNVTKMNYLFYNSCRKEQFLDLRHFDTSKVTTMAQMFCNFNGSGVDVSSFDTSQVLYMDSMFSGGFTKVDISSFTTEMLRSATGMFYGAKLETIIINNPKLFKMPNINMLSNSNVAKGTAYVYVPDDMVETYKTTTNWSTYATQIKGISELPAEEA